MELMGCVALGLAMQEDREEHRTKYHDADRDTDLEDQNMEVVDIAVEGGDALSDIEWLGCVYHCGATQ